MRTLTLGCVGALALLAHAGCIVIPVPRPETRVHDSRRSLHQPAVKLMNAAAVTRADVLLALGEPDLSWDDGRVIVYRWTTTKMTFIVIYGAGYQGDIGAVDSPINHFLYFEFDPAGRVQCWEHRVAPFNIHGDEYTRRIWRNW